MNTMKTDSMNSGAASQLIRENGPWLSLFKDCGTNLASILTGRIDPLSVIFPGGSFKRVKKIYQDTPQSRYYNGILASTVNRLAAALPMDRELRILEVGGGTGSTTAAIVPYLPAERTTYVFTDVSDIFLQKAVQRFNDYPFMKFKIFDLTGDINAQGFELNGFDMVIASNVIHATPDIRYSLCTIRALLASYGILIMREITVPKPLMGFEITFGPLLGQLSDTELRQNHPFLSVPGWKTLLENEKYDRVAAFPEDQDDVGDEHIIIARNAAGNSARSAFRLQHLQSGSQDSFEDSHPLLGMELPSPLSQVQFQNRLSSARPSFLKEHRVFNFVVVPGTAHFEIAAAAGRAYFNRDNVVLENIQLREALILPEDQERLLQVVLNPQDDETAKFDIFSRESIGNNQPLKKDWHLHATGILRQGTESDVRTDSLEEFRRICTQEIDVDAYYKGFAEFGAVQYGPPFQGIKRLWRNTGEALGEVTLERSLLAEKDAYGIHPALLDCCLQCMVATGISGEEDLQTGDGFMPFNAERVHFYRQAPTTVWCHARVNDGTSFKQEFFAADFTILNPEGELVAKVENLYMKRTTRATLERLKFSQQSVTDMLYEVSWKKGPQLADEPTRGKSAWLLFADRETETALAFARELEKTGQSAQLIHYAEQPAHNHAVVNPGAKEDFFSLIQQWLKQWAETAVEPAGIAFCWGLDGALYKTGDIDGFNTYMERNCGSILNLVQALSADDSGKSPRLCLMTRGAKRIQDKEKPLIMPNALWGIQQSLANEHPELNPLVIDLDPGASGHEDVKLATRLLLATGYPEDKIAIRGDLLMVPRLIPGKIPSDVSRSPVPGSTGIEEPYRLDVPEPGLENICLAPLERKKPGSGEIEIAVEAVGLNFKDVMIGMGLQPNDKTGLGVDCAGIVSAVGPDVNSLGVGDKVFATAYGSLASHVITPAQSAALIPDGLGFADAATIPTAFMTAWYSLCDEGGLTRADKVLLHSATGGVGLAAIQVARSLGAEIYATAGSEPKRALLRSMGIDHVYSSRTPEFKDRILEDTKGQGVDIVLNFLTGELIEAGLQSLAPGGTFLEIGRTDIRKKEEIALIRDDITYCVIDLEQMGFEAGDQLTEVFHTVMKGFTDNRFQPLPTRIFSFERASDAFRYMVEARHIGKVVLVKNALAGAGQGIRADACYLITGGLGPIGITLARDLVDQGAKQLLLLGRSKPSDEVRKNIDAFRQDGVDVVTAQVDVSDKASFEAFWTTLSDYLPLAGVFHLAGVLDDDTLLDLDWPRFAKVLAPKDIGALLLHDWTQDMELDYFVLFSSAAAIIGTHGQSNHVTANSLLDALAQYRQADFSPALSVNWGAWGGIGSVAELGIEERIATRGVKTFEPATGLGILRQLMATKLARMAVIEIDWSKMLDALSLSSGQRFFSEIKVKQRQSQAPAEKVDRGLRKKFEQLPLAERVEALQKYLFQEIANFLHIDVKDIPVEGDLIQLGMDSLISLDLFQRVSRDLQIRIAPHEILAKPYVAAMAEKFAHDLEPRGATTVRPTESSGVGEQSAPQTSKWSSDPYAPFPLSDLQQAYWVGRNTSLPLSQVGCHIYLEAETGDLDIVRYQQVWNQLITRHQALRTVILDDGTQKVLEDVPGLHIPVDRIANLPVEKQKQRLLERRSRLSHQLLDVSQWPTFDIEITEHGDGLQRIHFSFDLIICDFHGLSILMADLNKLYRDLDTVLPALDYTFREYRLAEEAFRDSDQYQAARKYWLDRLDSLPPGPELPLMRRPEEVHQTVFTRKSHRFSAETWGTLKEIATRKGFNPTGVVLAAFAQVIGYWSTSLRFCLNLTLFNRLPLHSQVDKIIGEFTSNSFLEVNLEESISFEEQANRIWKQLWSDMEHRSFSGVRVLRELARRGDEAETVFPVVFTSILGLGRSENNNFNLGGMGTEIYSLSQTPQVWLDHQVFEVDNELFLVWDHVEGLFPSGVLEDMFATYIGFLERLAHDPNAWESHTALELPPDQQAGRERVNATQSEINRDLLHASFLRQAVKNGDAPAVITATRILSYAEMEKRSRTISEHLEEKVEPGQLVAVLMEKGWEQVAAVLGILRAGAAYLPITTAQPEFRQRQLLQDGQVSVILTQSRLRDRLPEIEDANVFEIDRMPQAEGPIPDMAMTGRPDDLAYVIYTSGSTGSPKGVMISHTGALNTVLDVNSRFGVMTQDRILAVSDLGFDLSVYDIFGAFAAGGAVVIPDHDRFRDPEHWTDLIEQYEISVWNSVPALMQMLLDYAETTDHSPLHSLRRVLLSGDWIPLDLPDRIRSAANQAQIIGLGGATEASIWSNYFVITDIDPEWKSIPYGLPLTNQCFHILNESLQDCPDWVAGKLFIGGTGLAKGYWNDPEKTEKSFIIHPRSGERIYSTGDLGRYLPSGDIEFLGRKDFQVKIRGNRVELGEIESRLKEHPEVRDAVVMPVGGRKMDKRLISYVVAEEAEPQREPSLFKHKFADPEEIRARWDALLDAGARQARQVPSTITPALLKFWDTMESSSLICMCHTLRRLGVFKERQERHSPQSLLMRGEIKPEYERLLTRWFNILAKNGLLKREKDGTYINAQPLPGESADELWREMDAYANPDDYTQTALDYIKRAVDHHPELLKGKMDALHLLFPDGSWDVAESLYQFNPISEYYNNIVRETVRTLSGAWPPTQKLRILEVGAGVGGTTAGLLPVVSPDNTIYTYTDITSFFHEGARRKFKDFPFVEYGVFNIDHHPRDVGYDNHTFDVIIAANALHDARDIGATLVNLRGLLAPGGLMVMLEGTHNSLLQMITIEFIEGLRQFEDQRIKDNLPFLSEKKWHDMLNSSGFEHASTVNQSESPGEGFFEMHVIVAQAPLAAKLFQPTELTDFLEQKLPEYMIPREYTLLDALPVTSSGKIDRKILSAMGQTKNVVRERPFVAPQSDSEKKIAGIWTSLLGVEQVGSHDSFFELGGDSLSITQMFNKIRPLFDEGIEWSAILRSLFENPTIASISDNILKQTEKQARPSDGIPKERLQKFVRSRGETPVTLLKPGDSQLPFFCVHDGSGNLFPYIELTRNFTLEKPLYGIFVHDPDTYHQTDPQTLIQERAARYIAGMRTIQPHGPYTIAGYCLGGMIAFEMGRQLADQGEKLENIIAISSFQLPFKIEDEIFMLFYLFAKEMSIPGEKIGFHFDDALLGAFLNELIALNVKRTINASTIKTLREKKEYADILARYQKLKQMKTNERLRLVYDAAHSSLARFSIMRFSEFRNMYTTYKVSVTATMHYNPQPYPAPLTVLRPSGWEHFPSILDFWDTAASNGFDLFDIAGNHRTCLEAPHIDDLIQHLRRIFQNQDSEKAQN